MKLVGVAVIGSEEDMVETFVRHNLHYLDRLHVVLDHGADATGRILDLLVAEGLALAVTVSPPGASPLNAVFQAAVAAEGAGCYFPLTADDLILPLEVASREALRARLALVQGNAVFGIVRTCVFPNPTQGIAYGADNLRQFRFMESPDEVRRIGAPHARRLVLKLEGTEAAQGVSFAGDGNALMAGHALAQAADVSALCYAFVPLRSPAQMARRVLGGLTRHLAGGGSAHTLPPSIALLLEVLRTKDVGNDDLLASSKAWASDSGNGQVSLLQGDLSTLFHYQRRYDALLSGPLGAVGAQIVAAMTAFQGAGGLPGAEDPHAERRSLELALISGAPTFEAMERYFDLIERDQATDVPAAILEQAARLSTPPRQPVGMAADGKLVLPYLEMDISYACNLRCDGCSHYSNYALPGVVRFADAQAWLSAWSERLHPLRFRLLGGEPAINPDAHKIIRLAAELFPNSDRALVSNGLLLHKRADILQALAETGTALNISLHDQTEETRAEINRIQAWAQDLGVRCVVSAAIPEDFTRLYQGTGKDIIPFDDKQPFASWACCDEKNCACIHDGLLWKCPPLAFLGPLDKKITLRPEWQRYLAHRGLPPSAPADQLYAYLVYPEKDCDMCPARRP